MSKKAVLVIDMPNNCYECPMEHDLGCSVSWKEVESLDRPEWCPLRPLPELRHKEKYAYTYELTYDQGYNRAIKEITGEAEKADAENQWWEEHSSRFD